MDQLKIRPETLTNVLSKMLGITVLHADYQTKQLHGGTVGDVRLVTGMAQTAEGSQSSYSVILKTQKQWERYGDPASWRREYDLFSSHLGTTFPDSFRWPKCYHAVINEDENETQIWMEHIDGISGQDLTGDMYERSAEELGRYQGKLYAEKPAVLQNLTNLSQVEFTKNNYWHYRSWTEIYNYIRSDDCEIPRHLCQMLIDIDENADKIWSRIEKLPIVLCHRDFWVTNIFYSDENIVLIDWDTTGWGYLGEDIASLIADEADVDHMVEYSRRCIPAYYRGFSEYANVNVQDHCIYELILVVFGYRLVEWVKFAEGPDEKKLHLDTLQNIYEMRHM